ncbi:MAG TPA: phosphatidylserine decarboxylase family protein [Cytophagaceae bacterium]|jgi:phosphatidylserine decarboxylase|nr:phosphatidylserine decarboxylase family protein [Cytophagaceae bacterium]
MIIHKEGRTLLLVLFLALTAVSTVGVLFLSSPGSCIIASVSLLIFLVVLQFFRSPSRAWVTGNDLIIAPADGKVVVIEEVFEPEYFKDKRIQVSIFMSPINVHVNRHPISGIIKYFKYHPGLYLVAWHPKASTDNERTTVVIERTDGKTLLLRQIAGALAKRIVWYIKETDKAVQTEELGFIKFGSRVDLFLPLDTKINVTLGQKTKGGITVVGTWK